MRENLRDVIEGVLIENQYRLATTVPDESGPRIHPDTLKNVAREIAVRLDPYVTALKDEQEN